MRRPEGVSTLLSVTAARGRDGDGACVPTPPWSRRLMRCCGLLRLLRPFRRLRNEPRQDLEA